MHPLLPLAYIDPTSGGLLGQLLLAGTAGIGIFLRLKCRQIFALFLRKSEKKRADESGS